MLIMFSLNSYILIRNPGVRHFKSLIVVHKIVLLTFLVFFMFLLLYYNNKFCYKKEVVVKQCVENFIYLEVTSDGNTDGKNISCHDDIEELLSFSPPERSIFFIETSCKGIFNSRQACSIESAARANPSNQIYVLAAGPLRNRTVHGEPLRTLKTMSNVHFYRIIPKIFSKNTVLESFFGNNLLKTSPHSVSHSSDVLRTLTLNKYGGIYLDLDVIVVKSLASLPENFVTKQSNAEVSAGILGLSNNGIGKEFSDAALRDLSSSYDPKSWAHNGPLLIQRTLQKMCEQQNIFNISAENCRGFHVFEPRFFYPIFYPSHNKYFENVTLNIKDEYTHHVWNKLNSNKKIKKDSLYERLAKNFCPKVHSLYGEDFGL